MKTLTPTLLTLFVCAHPVWVYGQASPSPNATHWNDASFMVQGQTTNSAMDFKINKRKDEGNSDTYTYTFGFDLSLPISTQDDTPEGALTRPFNGVSGSPSVGYAHKSNEDDPFNWLLNLSMPLSDSQFTWTNATGGAQSKTNKVDFGFKADFNFYWGFLKKRNFEGDVSASRLFNWVGATSVGVVQPQTSGPQTVVNRTLSGPTYSPETVIKANMDWKDHSLRIGLGAAYGKVWTIKQDVTRPEGWLYYYPKEIASANSRIGIGYYRSAYSDGTPATAGVLVKLDIGHNWWQNN